MPSRYLWRSYGQVRINVPFAQYRCASIPCSSHCPAARCYKLGQAIGRAIESWEEDARVVIIGTGGLSHQLDGQRAGFINKDFDLMFMDMLIRDRLWVTRYSIADLVELTGTQGVELLMWLVTRGVLLGEVTKVHSNYHIPISNTASGLMVMEGV
jgi:protocatechuate 4,5-dioxygenase beta chain